MESVVRVVVFLVTVLGLAALAGVGIALFGETIGPDDEVNLIKLLGGVGSVVAFFLNGPITGAIMRKRHNRRQ